ncbi:phage tail assembly chaperone [Pseudomonas sp. NPDC087346]|uniref:phage tail assembly chaperone n=1 Tax=Pseudomonas sp. NPDC087346 TaxID=3364438 RepID=UPI0038046D29
MSKNKLHYDNSGYVYGYGDLPSTQFVEVENFEEALQAFSGRKSLRIVDGELVIEVSREEKMKEVLRARDELMADSDLFRVRLLDSEDIAGTIDTLGRQRLAIYRQALRDVTLQDPFAVNWPTLETNDE